MYGAQGDVQAVLLALEDVITDALKSGEIVRLGDLCTLQVSLSGKGALTEDDYNTSLIKKVSIRFRPGRLIREVQNLENLKFKKVGLLRTKATDPEEEEGGEDLTN